jgi:hypothetical protein
MAKVNARYALEAAGEIAKEGVAGVGIAATYATPGMMPREWAEWSFDKLKGDGYFKKHEENIAAASAVVEMLEGGAGFLSPMALVMGYSPSGNLDRDAAFIGPAMGLGVYAFFEGVGRMAYAGDKKYKSNLPVSIISDGIRAASRTGEFAKKFGNHVSETYQHVAEKYQGNEK